MTTRWRVVIIESDREFGERVDEVQFFNDYDAAEDFVTDFNSQNDKKEVPEWHMYARDPVPVD